MKRQRLAAALLAFSANLIASWSPAQAQHATAFDIEDGERAFESSCANCHGPDGDLIAGIDLGRGLFRRPLSDEDIVGIILNGIPNTPMPPTPSVSEEQALRIVAYLRSTAATPPGVTAEGNPARGRELFAGEGGCVDCHRVNGRGSRLGPDLSRIGLARKTVELEQSLLEPGAEVQAMNRFYRVTTTDGRTIEGRLLNHDTFSVQLIDANQRLLSFSKSDLRDHGFIDTPMPSYRDELNAQQIADIVSYLVSLRGLSTP